MKTLQERFLAKIAHADAACCWRWLGFIDKAGYGRIRLGGRSEPVGYAHRVSYELSRGPIPDGLHLDHLCRNRACVNPNHLEAVTCGENVRRGAAPSAQRHAAGICKRGHLLADGYSRPDRKGINCTACRQDRRRISAELTRARRHQILTGSTR